MNVENEQQSKREGFDTFCAFQPRDLRLLIVELSKDDAQLFSNVRTADSLVPRLPHAWLQHDAVITTLIGGMLFHSVEPGDRGSWRWGLFEMVVHI